MADGTRYLDHSVGDLYLNSLIPKETAADAIPLNTLLRQFSAKDSNTPTPSNPIPRANLLGMFSQNHQQGPNSRINGGHGGRASRCCTTTNSSNSNITRLISSTTKLPRPNMLRTMAMEV